MCDHNNSIGFEANIIWNSYIFLRSYVFEEYSCYTPGSLLHLIKVKQN